MLLHRAVQENQISDVNKLLEQGTDVNAKDGIGNTVLHTVQDKDMASLILRASPDLNAQNDNGDTSLHVWCMPDLKQLHDLSEAISQKRQILAMLLEAGASPNIQNYLGYSILHTVFVYGGMAGLGLDADVIRDMVTLLLKYHVDVNLEDFEGCTALHHAVREPNTTSITELLLQAGTSVNAQDCRGMTPLHYLFDLDDIQTVMLLIRYGCSMNEKDINGTTTLSYAVQVGNELMAELLLSDPRTDINLGDKNHITPLHLAVAFKQIGVCEILIANAANVDAKDIWNATPLHYAAYGGTPEIITLLLQGNANDKLKDNLGNLPVQLALERHYFHTASAFGEAYLQDIRVRSTTDANGDANDLETDILKSFPADDVFTIIVPSSRIFSNPYDLDILPPDTIDYFKTKSNRDSSAYVCRMIEVPGIGKIPDIEEANEVRQSVENFIQKMVSKMAELDQRFSGSLLCSGSVYEGTKICDPDEFDYMLCLDRLQEICTVEFDENTSFDNVRVCKHANVVDTSFDGFFDEKQLQSVDLMNKFVEIARKAMSCLNYSTGSDKLYLQSLTENTLVDGTWVLTGTVTCNLKLHWNGLYYKQLVICVDLVPAIHIDYWPHIARKESHLLTADIMSKGCHVVCKSGYWRLSFSLAEKLIMQDLSSEQKSAFIGAKMMLHPALTAKVTLYDDNVLIDDNDSRFLDRHGVDQADNVDKQGTSSDTPCTYDDSKAAKQEVPTSPVSVVSSNSIDRPADSCAQQEKERNQQEHKTPEPRKCVNDENREQKEGTYGAIAGEFMLPSGNDSSVLDRHGLDQPDNVDKQGASSDPPCTYDDSKAAKQVPTSPVSVVSSSSIDRPADSCAQQEKERKQQEYETPEPGKFVTDENREKKEGTYGAIAGKFMLPSGTPVTLLSVSDTEKLLNVNVGDRVTVFSSEDEYIADTTSDSSGSDIPTKTIEPRDVISTYMLKMLFFHCIEENAKHPSDTIVTTEQIFNHLYMCLKEKTPLPYYFMQTHNIMDKLIENEDLCVLEFIVTILNTFFRSKTLIQMR